MRFEDHLMIGNEALQKSYDSFREVDDPVAFMATIGTLIDQWAVDHGMPSAAMSELLYMLAAVHDNVNEEHGPMPKSN